MPTPHLFNSTADVVTENIKALCALHPHLRYLDGFPKVKVVLQAELNKDNCVSVVSGGGAGHEPAHAGYVGSGMLAAAVVGDVFASPPAEAILAAIRAVTGRAGCLLIIMNYTGDRLNFGLAMERARAEGLNAELVIVGDDCALPGTGLAGRRGIAGTVLVNKIAGAAAAAGLSLGDVKAEAEAVARSVGSMGMATQICSIPGEAPPRGSEDNTVEMGLGIHGEPGAYKQELGSAHQMVAEVTDTIIKFMRCSVDDADYALMLNNLGTTSCLEMGVLLHSTLQHLKAKQTVRIVRVYSGTYMTATDMSGFSISLLKLKEGWTDYLDQEAKVPGWQNLDASYSQACVAVPIAAARKQEFLRPDVVSDFGQCAAGCLTSAAENLIIAAPQLDDWDRSVGDGDCGSTIRRGANAILQAVANMPLNDAGQLCLCLADCVNAMGGTSGALYNILFTAAAGVLPNTGAATPKEISQAFTLGAQKIIQYGGAQEGNRTMLDALLPAANAFQLAIQSGDKGGIAVIRAARAAKEGAAATMHMVAGAGRSSYIPDENLEGIPDPGAEVVSIWLQAVAEALGA